MNRIRLLLVVVAVLLLSACEFPSPDEPVEGQLFEQATYAEAGPYAVGVTTLTLDDREVEVWYPAKRGAVRHAEKYSYYIRDFTSPLVQSLLPPDINPPFETDAYRDVRARRGRKSPVVLFSHGSMSFRNQSTFLTTHLASWGFVVASPDFLERGLQGFLGTPTDTPKTSLEVLDETVALLESENATRGSRLWRRLDTKTILPIGHSAGGSASAAFVNANGAPAWSPMAAGGAGAAGSAGIWIAGRNDQIAELSRIESAYEAAPGPKRLVVIDGAGHNNAFSDICEIGEGGGGVIAIAREAGLPIPDSLARLAEDGCNEPNLPSAEVWPVVRHFVTAHLSFQAGIRRVPWGLDDDVVDRFDVPVRYEQVGAES